MEIAEDFGDVIVHDVGPAGGILMPPQPPPPPPEGFQDDDSPVPSVAEDIGSGQRARQIVREMQQPQHALETSAAMCTPPIHMASSESRATLAAAEGEEEEDERLIVTLTQPPTEASATAAAAADADNDAAEQTKAGVKVEATLTF